MKGIYSMIPFHTVVLFFALLSLSIVSAQQTSLSGSATVQGKITAIGDDDFAQDMLRSRVMERYAHGAIVHTRIEPYKISEKAVVYLESAQVESSYDPPDDHPQLNQQDMMFRPLVLPIIAGTTVDFPNNDNLFHNVFSYSQPREFDLGRYPRGQKRSVTFDKPGIINVYCDIHSYMYATILVLKNPFFTAPDEDGNYEIDQIPPGNYRLNFWYGRKQVESKNISLKSGQAITENFAR